MLRTSKQITLAKAFSLFIVFTIILLYLNIEECGKSNESIPDPGQRKTVNSTEGRFEAEAVLTVATEVRNEIEKEMKFIYKYNNTDIKESYGVKILLLVRDPRATMVSRNQTDWCTEPYPSCSDPAFLCSDLLADYATAVRFKRDYPDTFRVIRFEDLTSSVYARTKDMLDFLGLPANRKTDEFLKKSTRSDSQGLYSLERKTKDVATRWKTTADYGFVRRVEEPCKTAMRVWGYRPIPDEAQIKSFDPILPFNEF